jgi:hypothetical protein
VTVLCRFVGVALVSLAVTPALRAQAYRVMLANQQSPIVTIAEFRPCVIGETARCGAWIDRDVDTRTDHSVGQPPGVVVRGRTTNGKYDLSFAAVAVRVTSIMMPDSGRHADVKVSTRSPTALALSPDSRYAFAVYQSLVGQPPQVCMIDLAKHEVIATLGTKMPVSAISVVP